MTEGFIFASEVGPEASGDRGRAGSRHAEHGPTIRGKGRIAWPESWCWSRRPPIWPSGCVLGGARSSSVLSAGRYLAKFSLCIDRVAKVFTYAGCKVNKATFQGSKGG